MTSEFIVRKVYKAFTIIASLVLSFWFLIAQAPALAAEQVTLTATIEPLANSADINISGSPVNGSILTQSQEVTITLSYRHSAGGSFPMEIIGTWEQGLIEGTGSNYIDIFDYVIGSATLSDSGTAPVVDLINRKITWNINSVNPSTTYHNVSFKLKVKDNIPTDNRISANIKAQGKLSGTALAGKEISYLILKSQSPSSTSTPTPTSAASIPTPTTAPTGQPTPVPHQPFKFDFVRISEIADTYLTAVFQTNRPGIYTLSYGESPNALTKTIKGLTPQKLHRLTIPALLPKTQYYFKIVTTDQAGNEIISDLFTATTASSEETIKLSSEAFTIHWKNYFLLSQSINTVVLPKGKPITVTAKIDNSTNISKIKAVFTNENVLGINNLTPRANIGETPLIEIIPGIFSGEIQSPTHKGIYSMLFDVTDVAGGVYKKAAPYKFYISDPLRVVDKKSGKPVENAEVKITKYQESLKLFAPLGNSFALVVRTDENGELDIVLPTGTYDIEVKAAHYDSINKNIELGISTTNYPVFELESDDSIQGKITYYREALADLSGFTEDAVKNIFSSQRAKDLFLIFSSVLLLLLIILDTHIKKRLGLMRKIITFSILDLFVLLSGITTLLFIKYLGVSEAALLLASTIFIFILGIIYIKKAFFKNKN